MFSFYDNKFYNILGYDINKKIFWILFISLISGAMRKWIFITGTFGNFILLMQLLLPFLFIFQFKSFFSLFKQSIFKFYILYLFICAFNPLNLTIFHGILGIILYLGFWLIIFYYKENRTLIDVRPLLPVIIIICFFEIILGFIQYQLPYDHFLNKYADLKQLGENQGVALVGNSVRITGSFSYISGFTSFLIFLILFIWSLIRFNYNKTIISFLLSGTVVAALMSGSRSTVLLILIIIFLILISEFTFRTITEFLKSLFFPFLLFLLFFLAKGNFGFENIIDQAFINFNDRRVSNAQTGEQTQRIFGDLNELFVNFRGNHPFFGVGLGATYQGATALFGTSDYVKEYGYYEGELPRVVLESGFTMLIFRFLLFIWLFTWIEINWYSKIICFFVFNYGISIVFNVYGFIFLALGLLFLDNSGLLSKKRFL